MNEEETTIALFEQAIGRLHRADSSPVVISFMSIPDVDKAVTEILNKKSDLLAPFMDTVGFTGTREGMTMQQVKAITAILIQLAPTRVRHGVCIGADDDFHVISKNAGIFVIGHPGVNRQGMCPTRGIAKCDFMLPEKWFIDRDHDIVDFSGVLIAAPKGPEVWRSGTWTTIRYAKKIKRHTIIVCPDGVIEDSGEEK